jgi:hypothetical protein
MGLKHASDHAGTVPVMNGTTNASRLQCTVPEKEITCLVLCANLQELGDRASSELGGEDAGQLTAVDSQQALLHPIMSFSSRPCL